jgi:hypothetical protein
MTSHPDFPAERLIACRNPALATLRHHKRQSLLAATEQELEKVTGMVARGRLAGRDAIGVRVGKVVNKYKVAKPMIDRSHQSLRFPVALTPKSQPLVSSHH